MKRGKRVLGKGKGKQTRPKATLSIIAEARAESESLVCAEKNHRGKSFQIPSHLEAPTDQQNVPTSSNVDRLGSNHQNTTGDPVQDSQGKQEKPSTSRNVFIPNVFNRFLPKDSLRSVEDAESRILQDGEGELDSKEYGSPEGTHEEVLRATSTTDESCEKSAAMKTANDEDEGESGPTVTTG